MASSPVARPPPDGVSGTPLTVAGALVVLSVTLAGCGRPRRVGRRRPGGDRRLRYETQARPGRPAGRCGVRRAGRAGAAAGCRPGRWPGYPGTRGRSSWSPGRGKDFPVSQVVLCRRTGAGWERGATSAATRRPERVRRRPHHAGDLRSPIGVFALQPTRRTPARPRYQAALRPVGRVRHRRYRLRGGVARPAPSTTSSRSTTTTSRALRPSTGPTPARRRARAAASGCTSTTEPPRRLCRPGPGAPWKESDCARSIRHAR